MIIEEASFECTIAMPGYSNVKPGVPRVRLEPGETIEDVWDKLHDRAMAWHKKKYPHLYPDTEQPKEKDLSNWEGGAQRVPIPPPVGEINLQHERLRDSIDDCQSLEDLFEWKSNNPVMPFPILLHFNKKMEELSNGG